MPLIVSQNLVLSDDDAALPAGTPIILWDNIVTIDNVEADSEAEGYPATNLANPATNQEWRAGSADSPAPSTVEITITTNSAEDIAAVGVARHNFGSAGISVEVGYYNPSSPTEWVSLAGPVTPGSDEPLLFRFTAQPLAQVVIQLLGGDEDPRAAVLYCGPLLVMERGVDIAADFTVPRFARRTEFYNGRSERGDYLGRIVTSQFIEGVEHTFSHLDPDWYRSEIDPFVQAGQQDTPFFYCFAPDDYPLEVAFAWFAADPVPMTNPVTRRKKLVLKLDGIVE